MSNSAVLTDLSASSTVNTSEDLVDPPTRSHRGDRSAGKGRRRRAIAEQRRAELQDWSHFLHECEEEVYVAPPRPPVSRRQLRRAFRRSLNQEWDANFLDEDGDGVDVALALSLSLAEPGGASQDASLVGQSPLDMSYESLVMLENVKCTAAPTIVNRLTGHVFNKGTKESATDCVEEICTICQVEYNCDDLYMLLPCLHTFHETCGSEWFLKHSKLCPVCKHDITEGA